MLKRFVNIIAGDPHKRQIESYAPFVEEVNALEEEYERMNSAQLREKTDEFRALLHERLDGVKDETQSRKIEQDTLNEIMPEAFALVREASKRTIGLRHYDIQLIGGAAMHSGKIVEMKTGEGKTLVATLPLYLNALLGRGTHLITVNDYLARRDARWMAPIYNLLGLNVGVLQMAARTENGKKAFMVDLDVESPHEDQHQLVMVPRSDAYAADITYGTNSEFGFDYLRDNMTMRLDDRVQRDHYYAIIDEVDNVLIDEARTPLIISGPAHDEAEWYVQMAQVVRQLRPEDYEIDEKGRSVTLTEIGEARVEDLLGQPLRDPDRPEDVTLEQARLLGYLEQALRAQFLFRRNKDYLVQGGKVIIIDEFTGRLMPGRRWSDGLHQAVEAKEGVKVESESVTYATITIQNYFRMYEKLSGMTGTALTEAEEFHEIYKLEVLPMPTNLEYEASHPESDLIEKEGKDEYGYRFRYYAHNEDTNGDPVFWKRKDYPDVVYRTEEAKLRALAREILRYHVQGRPILVGTTSVELSERVSRRLRANPLRTLSQVFLLRDRWLEVNDQEEDGRIIPELEYLNHPLEGLNTAQMRQMARDLDIPFNPEHEANIPRLLSLLDLGSEDSDRLVGVLGAGIPHEVLNARKHTEESQIIAGAGAFGAVTIATNMAGRGVDIKLGGEIAEEILGAVNRVLNRSDGVDDPYGMTMEERREALLAMDHEEYGIYDSEVEYFFQHMSDMEKVRELGGLHVIGSERHEARRIDNQLRGRAARQGDPGSSRFYLSMEDELMRLFGGQQADGLMQRMRIDDAVPLEVGLVSRIVEQAQSRVEGANFDVRKHLLEYDDVLNSQRAKIYAQRNRVFRKSDLGDDVREMLRTELKQRVPQSLDDEEGPWKLLAWLDQIQPPLTIEDRVFPSYTMRLIVDEVLRGRETLSREEARESLLEVVRNALQAEEERLLFTVHNLLEQSQDRLETQMAERMEAVDIFFDGLSLADETDTRGPAELAAELEEILHLPLRLSSSEQRDLQNNPEEARDVVEERVESTLVSQTITRIVGAVERRLEESLELDLQALEMEGWTGLSEALMSSVEQVFEKREERFLGEGGLITRDLETALKRLSETLTRDDLLALLTLIPQGKRAAFDKRTHRRVWQRTVRLTYVDYAASLMETQMPEDVTKNVLAHLEQAQEAVQEAWGKAESIRLRDLPMAEFDGPTRQGLEQTLGEQLFLEHAGIPLSELPPNHHAPISTELGRQALTAIYRQLILSVVTELWVEYLTKMEALRVSIGLEAYAQRDPLVQYKARASTLFQQLLSDIRMGVVTRMFTYRPRDLSEVQTSLAEPEEQARQEPPPVPVEAVVQTAAAQASTAPQKPPSKKRRRRRRKK